MAPDVVEAAAAVEMDSIAAVTAAVVVVGDAIAGVDRCTLSAFSFFSSCLIKAGSIVVSVLILNLLFQLTGHAAIEQKHDVVDFFGGFLKMERTCTLFR